MNNCERCRKAGRAVVIQPNPPSHSPKRTDHSPGGAEGEYLPIATTRPETILGDTAVAVHPKDERYRHLIGRQAQVPLTDRRIPIIADEYVDPEFGTGALKITPGWRRLCVCVGGGYGGKP